MAVREFFGVWWSSFKGILDNVGFINTFFKSIGFFVLLIFPYLAFMLIYLLMFFFFLLITGSPMVFPLRTIIFLVSFFIYPYIMLVIIKIAYDLYKNKTIGPILSYFESAIKETQTLKNMFIGYLVLSIINYLLIYLFSPSIFNYLFSPDPDSTKFLTESSGFVNLLILFLLSIILFPIGIGTFLYIALKKASFIEGLNKGIELLRNVGVWISLVISLFIIVFIAFIVGILLAMLFGIIILIGGAIVSAVISPLLESGGSLLLILVVMGILGFLINVILTFVLLMFFFIFIHSINAMFIHALKKIGVDV